MVQRGQFLERPTVVASGGFFLEGLSHRGPARPALLICPPHPFRGMGMDAPVCAELAFAASQRGHATLRFDYRGAGASQGLPSGMEACLEDAQAALSLLCENVGHREVVAAGFDFGAAVALELARSGARLAGLALISPVTADHDFSPLAGLLAPALVLLGQMDEAVDRAGLADLCQASGDRLEVVPHADRLFVSGLPAMGREVARFLAELPGASGPEA